MTKVLVSGSSGFIGGYVVDELLAKGYTVVGIDNFSVARRSNDTRVVPVW